MLSKVIIDVIVAILVVMFAYIRLIIVQDALMVHFYIKINAFKNHEEANKSVRDRIFSIEVYVRGLMLIPSRQS